MNLIVTESTAPDIVIWYLHFYTLGPWITWQVLARLVEMMNFSPCAKCKFAWDNFLRCENTVDTHAQIAFAARAESSSLITWTCGFCPGWNPSPVSETISNETEIATLISTWFLSEPGLKFLLGNHPLDLWRSFQFANPCLMWSTCKWTRLVQTYSPEKLESLCSYYKF